MKRWKEYQVSQLIEQGVLSIGDGYRAKNSELSANESDGIPFARAGNINSGFDFSNADYFPKANRHVVGDKISRVGDTVFTSKGTVGRFAFVKDLSCQFIYSPQLCFWRSLDLDIIHPTFLFYWMQGREFYEQADAVKGQTDMADYVNLSDQRRMKITLPKIGEQKDIAAVLSSLDDKIDLLYSQNATLEKMAEILFRQWFVEERGESWKDGSLSDVLDLVYGKGLKENLRTGSGFPVVGSSGIVGLHSESLVESPGIVIGRKGTLGKVTYLFENFFPIDTTYFVKSKVDSVGLFYEYFLLKSMNFEEMNSDSAVPGLNREIALSTEIRIPSTLKINEFNSRCSVLFDKIKANRSQIRTLTTLRDTLLPKLMSGEIRVGQ